MDPIRRPSISTGNPRNLGFVPGGVTNGLACTYDGFFCYLRELSEMELFEKKLRALYAVESGRVNMSHLRHYFCSDGIGFRAAETEFGRCVRRFTHESLGTLLYYTYRCDHLGIEPEEYEAMYARPPNPSTFAGPPCNHDSGFDGGGEQPGASIPIKEVMAGDDGEGVEPIASPFSWSFDLSSCSGSEGGDSSCISSGMPSLLSRPSRDSSSGPGDSGGGIVIGLPDLIECVALSVSFDGTLDAPDSFAPIVLVGAFEYQLRGVPHSHCMAYNVDG